MGNNMGQMSAAYQDLDFDFFELTDEFDSFAESWSENDEDLA